MKVFLNIFFYLIIFLYSIGAIFNSISSLADTIVVVSILFTGIGLFMRINPPRIFKYFYFLIPLFIFVILRSTLYEFISIGSMIKIAFKPIKILMIPYSALVIVELISRYNDDYKDFIFRALHFSFVVNAVVVVMMFNDPAFKDAVYAYTTNGEFRSTTEYLYRMGAFSGTSGGAVLSVVQGFGSILSYLLLYNAKGARKIYYFLSMALCFYATSLIGRSGIWSALLFIPLSMLILNRDNIKSAVLQLSLLGVFFVVGLGFLSEYMSTLDSADPLSRSLGRTFDTFLRYDKTGSFEDKTVVELQNHILLPDSWEIILIGTPEHLILQGFDRTLNSDIGYIRDLWTYGFLGLMLYILPPIIILFYTIVNKQQSIEKAGLIMITLVMFLFHAKEGFMYTRMLFSIYSILLVLVYFKPKVKTVALNRKLQNG